MGDKITEEGKKAYYLSLSKKDKGAGLYVREMKTKSGGYEYKVATTKSPFLLKILHIFTRVSTKYFYGQDAIKKIQEKKLISVIVNKKMEEPPKEAAPPKKEEQLPDLNRELLEISLPFNQQLDEEALFLDPELRAFNIKEITEEAKQLASKFATISNPPSLQVRGQENLGNTCFMNSILHCLETVNGVQDPDCKDLLQTNLSLEDKEDLKGLESRILNKWRPLKDEEHILLKWTYLLLLQAKLKGTDADVGQALRLHHKLFFVTNSRNDFRRDIYGQKDAAEYLECLLEILGPKEMKVSDVFSAEINGQKVEKTKTNDAGNLIHISLDKNEHQTFISRLQASCHEMMQGPQEFTLPDNTPGFALEYTKATRYANPPRSLHFHIVRFENEGADTKKTHTKLQMDDLESNNSIDLSSLFDKEAKYQLTSFNVHQGELNGGHYVAYSLIGNKWYYRSDSTAYEVDKSQVPFEDAYILNFTKN